MAKRKKKTKTTKNMLKKITEKNIFSLYYK